MYSISREDQLGVAWRLSSMLLLLLVKKSPAPPPRAAAAGLECDIFAV